MRKLGIVLTAAALFDLGTVVVSSQAAEAVDMFLKVGKSAPSQTASAGATGSKHGKASAIFKFYKIDKANTPQACMAKGGTVVRRNGDQACQVEEANSAMGEVSTTR